MKQISLIVLSLFLLAGCAGTGGVSSRAVETEQISETVAPGKIHEVCYELSKGHEIAYRFQSTRTMDFNLHFHEGSVIEYPVERKATQSSEGVYTAPKDQFYCLMWTNNHKEHCKLEGSVTVRRQIKS